MKLKNFSRSLWSKILDYTPSRNSIDSAGDMKRPFHAVIYSVARIGDGIACSIAIKAIAQKYDDCKIFVVCSKYNKVCFDDIPNISLLTVSDDKNYIQIVLTAIKIKKSSPVDILFEPSASSSIGPLIFMRALKAARNITFRKSKMKMLDQVVLNADDSVISSHVKAMHSAGIEVNDETFSFYLNTLCESKIKDFLIAKDINEYIAINLYGFDEKRKIDVVTATEIIFAIKAVSKLKIILLCSPQTSDEVCFLSNEIDNVYCFLDTRTIHDSAALIKHSKCLISPDTSLVHIASAFNIPTLAIFLDEANYTHWPPTATGSQSILCSSMTSIPHDKVTAFIRDL